jgi:hypothetical protein
VRILLFILLGSLLFSSCGKKRSIHITATNAATGERYAGLQYFIVSSTTGADGEKYKTEKSGFLNENGEASEIIREKQYRTYAVRVVEPENSCYNKVITMYFGSPNDKNGHFNFEFAPCSYLKLHVHNTNCIDINDEIKFRRLWISGGETNNFLIQGGCFQYDGEYFSLPAGSYKYEWQVTKNGVTNNYESSFQLDENQYFDFNLDY